MIEIELGYADKIISDIYDDIDNKWAGIAISDGECPVGETINTGAKMIDDLNPLIVIKTANIKSLDVIIAACNRAKERLNQ